MAESFNISAVLEFVLRGAENVSKSSELLLKNAESAAKAAASTAEAAEKSEKAAGSEKKASEEAEQAAKNLESTSEKMKKVAETLNQIANTMVIAGAAILGALGGVIDKGLEYEGTLAEMADKTGIGVKALQTLGFAAESTGHSMEQILPAINIMSRGIFDAENGTGRAKDSFRLLGLSMDELKGHTPDEQLRIITNRLGSISDANERTKITMDIFGRSGVEAIAPLVGKMDEFAENSKKLVPITGEMAEKAQDLNEELKGVWAQIQNLAAVIVNDLLPVMKPIVDEISKVVEAFARFAQAHPFIVQIASALAGLLGVALVVGGTLLKLVGVGLSLAANFALATGAATKMNASLAGTALSGAEAAAGLGEVAVAGDAAAVSLGAAGVAAGTADVATAGIGVAAIASLPGIAAMGAALWAALAPVLPIVLLIGAVLALIGAVGYEGYKLLSTPNAPDFNASHLDNGPQVTRSSNTAGGPGSVHEYNINIRHETSQDPRWNETIKNQINQFSRDFANASPSLGT